MLKGQSLNDLSSKMENALVTCASQQSEEADKTTLKKSVGIGLKLFEMKNVFLLLGLFIGVLAFGQACTCSASNSCSVSSSCEGIAICYRNNNRCHCACIKKPEGPIAINSAFQVDADCLKLRENLHFKLTGVQFRPALRSKEEQESNI